MEVIDTNLCVSSCVVKIYDLPPAGEKFTTISTWRREGEGWTQDGAYGVRSLDSDLNK